MNQRLPFITQSIKYRLFPLKTESLTSTEHPAPSLLRRIVRNTNSNACISIATTKPTRKPSRPLRLCGSIFSLSYNHQSAILNHQSNASPITHPLIAHAIIYNLSSLTRVVKGKSIKDLTPFLCGCRDHRHYGLHFPLP